MMKAKIANITPNIRACTSADVQEMAAIINDSAVAYKGVIPADRWHEPYMPLEELNHEIAAGVQFSGYFEEGVLLGVMGIQDVKDVTLIRHAYVRTLARNQGIGGKLLAHLLAQTQRPVLIGTWAASTWAIRSAGSARPAATPASSPACGPAAFPNPPWRRSFSRMLSISST